jgi:menaquinone-dependent protoporphyrinogen oxidase
VELLPVEQAPECLMGYGAVIAGGAIHIGHHDRSLRDYVKRHAGDLSTIPSAFFSVSLSAAGDETEREAASCYVEELIRESGWHPDAVAMFGGALQYTHYGFVKRKVMQAIARRGGKPSDGKRDDELTDGDAVDRFARDMLHLIEARGEAQPQWD